MVIGGDRSVVCVNVLVEQMFKKRLAISVNDVYSRTMTTHCGCENETHFNGRAHKYGRPEDTDGDVRTYVTDYGTETFCHRCVDECFHAAGYRCERIGIDR